MTPTQPYLQHDRLSLEEPPGTPQYIAELFSEMSRDTVSNISSQHTVDALGGTVSGDGDTPTAPWWSTQEQFHTVEEQGSPPLGYDALNGFHADDSIVFNITQPCISYYPTSDGVGYLSHLPHENIATPVDHLSGRYQMGPVDSIYTAVPATSYLDYTAKFHVGAPYSLDRPVVISAGDDSFEYADSSILLPTLWTPELRLPDDASWQSQPVKTTPSSTYPRSMVPPNDAVSQTDGRVSTKRKRATCQGIFGECPHRFGDTRCFTQAEIATCNRLCNLLTGRPLDWSIYGLGSGDVKLLRSKWPNVLQDQIDACWRYINRFRSYNMVIHSRGLCEVANEQKMSSTIFRQQTHYPTQSWEKDLDDLLTKVVDTLAEWDRGQLEVLLINAQLSMHNGNAFCSAAEPPTSNIASSFPYIDSRFCPGGCGFDGDATS